MAFHADEKLFWYFVSSYLKELSSFVNPVVESEFQMLTFLA